MSRPVTPPKPLVNSEQPADLRKQFFLRMQLMLGAGIFVGLNIVILTAGIHVIWAVILAAVLALLNGVAEAQLAGAFSNQGSFPNQWSNPSGIPPHALWLQFIIDWTLFLARLAVAATVMLGLAGYWLNSFPNLSSIWLVPIAIVNLILLAIAATQRQIVARFCRVGVMVSLVVLLGLIAIGLPQVLWTQPATLNWVIPTEKGLPTWAVLLQATALMTAAYSGFESGLSRPTLMSIRQSWKMTKLVIGLLWLLLISVAAVTISTLDNSLLARTMPPLAPLALVMQQLAVPGGNGLVTLGAVAACAGTLLALLPKLADRLVRLTQPIDGSATWQMQRASLMLTPRAAWILVTVTIGCITLTGDMEWLWSFSAVMFLMHAALLHLVALQPGQIRLYSRSLHGLGLTFCLFLIVWLDWTIWLFCLGLVAVGVLWYGMTLWSETEE